MGQGKDYEMWSVVSVMIAYSMSPLVFACNSVLCTMQLWGFAYGSKYEETIAQCRTEAPGICRW